MSFIHRALSLAFLTLVGCSTAPSTTPVVAPLPPPKDDGKPSKGGAAGNGHSAALEQLKSAPLRKAFDKQNSVGIPLPDGERWTRVKFWGVPSLVGFRYGKEHHALVGMFVTHVDDPKAPRACVESFEKWAGPWIQAFEVDVHHDAPQSIVWNSSIVDVDSVTAKTATVLSNESYAGVYATYPAWKGACLIVGLAVPVGDDEARAKDVRDRFAREVLPKIELLTKEEPKERY